jgi:hypothetical protein
LLRDRQDDGRASKESGERDLGWRAAVLLGDRGEDRLGLGDVAAGPGVPFELNEDPLQTPTRKTNKS